MTTTAHQLLDHLLDDLKKELCAKMQQDIALELEKKERDLQNMVADMLAEHREEMVELLMNKVHQEIKQEFEMYAEATNDAMDSFVGEMKCQFYEHIEKMVKKEGSLQLQTKMIEEQEKKAEKKEEKKEEEKSVEKEEEKEVSSKMQAGPATNRLFFRRDIFKEKIIEEVESQSLLAKNDYD